MAAYGPRFLAGGTIMPFRFVRLSSPFTVIQATGLTDRIIGISQPGTRQAPGTGGSGEAALAGEPINVFGDGEEALLELGGTVAVGDYLRSDASGRGVALTFTSGAGTAHFGARALEPGVSGEIRRVLVHTGPATGTTG